jgi:hypothetical protein
MKTLLEKAKEIKTISRFNITNEHIELSLAWLKGEIKSTQVAKIFSKNRTNVPYNMAIWLKAAYERGKLIIQ